MKKELWHYANWELFGNWVYGSTINHEHITDNGKIHQQEQFIKIGKDAAATFYHPVDPADTYYVKAVKGNDYYIIPKRFMSSFPIRVTSHIDMKLKEKETHVWKFVSDSTSLAIPEVKSMTLKEFINVWNPLEHSNPKSFVLLKLISLAHGLKLGVCSPMGTGKNANLIIKRHIDRKTLPKIKATTKAMLYRELFYNNYVNLDEITSWSKTIIGEVEDLIADFGDESPDIQKHATDKNKNLELMKNVLYKSLTFTFNPYHSRDNPYTFEEKFRNPGKIKDRYPIIFIDGKVLDSISKPSNAEAEANVAMNKEEYKKLASEYMYWNNNYDKEMHGWNRSSAKFTRRHLSNINPLLDVLDVYSESQQEFEDWLRYLESCRDAYSEKSSFNEELPLKIDEEFVD
jgi:hypothetical protein